LSYRTIQRWQARGVTDQRKGAAKNVPRRLNEIDQAKIVSVCCSETYRNITPYEIVPLLADTGMFIASESSFYRVLRQHGLLSSKKPRTRAKGQIPDELAASAINQIWSWDISYLKTHIRGTYFYLYLFMDVFSRAIMGWEIHEAESGEASALLFTRLCTMWAAKGVILHSDNGSPMRCSHMLATLQHLGVTPSFSRPSVSNDNPYSESLFKTLKYTAGYPKSFQTIELARVWMTKFEHWYNNIHRHSRIQYVTPMQRHTGKDKAILAKRTVVYRQAHLINPNRWPDKIRSWIRPAFVFLKRPNHKNPTKTAA
jgi:putative transposase